VNVQPTVIIGLELVGDAQSAGGLSTIQVNLEGNSACRTHLAEVRGIRVLPGGPGSGADGLELQLGTPAQSGVSSDSARSLRFVTYL